MLTQFNNERMKKGSVLSERDKLEVEIYDLQMQNEFIRERLKKLSKHLAKHHESIDNFMMDEELDDYQKNIDKIEMNRCLWSEALLRNEREIDLKKARIILDEYVNLMQMQAKLKVVAANRKFSSM